MNKGWLVSFCIMIFLFLIGLMFVAANPNPETCISGVSYIQAINGSLTVAYLPSGEIKPCEK